MYMTAMQWLCTADISPYLVWHCTIMSVIMGATVTLANINYRTILGCVWLNPHI